MAPGALVLSVTEKTIHVGVDRRTLNPGGPDAAFSGLRVGHLGGNRPAAHAELRWPSATSMNRTTGRA